MNISFSWQIAHTIFHLPQEVFFKPDLHPLRPDRLFGIRALSRRQDRIRLHQGRCIPHIHKTDHAELVSDALREISSRLSPEAQAQSIVEVSAFRLHGDADRSHVIGKSQDPFHRSPSGRTDASVIGVVDGVLTLNAWRPIPIMAMVICLEGAFWPKSRDGMTSGDTPAANMLPSKERRDNVVFIMV